MVSINYSSREVCCKIVYYGPGLSGKTTNLLHVHEKVPSTSRGKMISLATEADRTLYFDFLPLNIGNINGFAAKFQLYTVPGQVYYNATRKLVLRGVDGLVFVADSQADKMDENIESLANLEENLIEYGYDPDKLPLVIQYNKRDLPNVLSVEELNAKLNPRGWPHFEASATKGTGVFDTLKLIIKLVLEGAKKGAPTQTPKVQPAVSTPEPAVTAQSQPETETREPEMATCQGGGTATAVKPEIITAGKSDLESRPYPGSGQSSTREAKLSVSSFSPSSTEEPEAEDMNRKLISQDDTEAATSEDSPSRPAMAPSLRRRPKAKKRGFFKRLFGIR